jgi:glycogen synthase
VDRLLGSLTEEGATIYVVCPSNHQYRNSMERNPRLKVCPTAARCTDPKRGFARKIWANLRFLASSAQVLANTARRGDIVHFQYNLHFPFGALFFLVARLRGARIVFTVHDPLPHKWMLPKGLRWIERSALAWAYETSDRLIVHSEAGLKTLVDKFRLNASKIKVIAHGPYELGTGLLPIPKSESLEVLLFGALRENKGAHLAIEAVQRLHAEGLRVRLTIAGSVLNRKEQAYWTECRKKIEQNPEPIRLIERFVPDTELPGLFSACHCFLLPYTEFSSDSGVAFMALANGRSIISTKSGGLGALLEASGGGITISDPTVDAVADALRQAVALSSAELHRRGRAGTAWVLRECGWPKVARETSRVYAQSFGAANGESLLARRGLAILAEARRAQPE